MSGEDLVSRCKTDDSRVITDVLDRLREVSVDFKQKADRFKVCVWLFSCKYKIARYVQKVYPVQMHISQR